MKRRIALLLVGILTLGACGQNGNGSDVAGQQEQSQVTESQTQENADKQEQGLPVVSVETLTAERYTEDGETMLSQVTIDSVTLSGAGFEKAAEAVERLLHKSQSEIDSTADELADMAIDQYQFEKESGYDYFSAYSEYTSYGIGRLDEKVLSLNAFSYDYTGGAHGYGAEYGINIDLERGVELELPHLATDPNGFLNCATEVILADLAGREEELFPEYKEYIKEGLDQVGWYLDAAGIEFTFSPYEIGPYASGTIIVCVPYESVAEYLKPEFAGLQGAGVAKVPMDETVSLSLGADGVSGSLSCSVVPVGDYGYDTILNLNGAETTIGDDVYMTTMYLLEKPGGRTFFVYCYDWASDDYETKICDISSGKPVETDALFAQLDSSNMGADRLSCSHILQVFGTRGARMEYTLSEEGTLEAMSPIFEFPEYAGRPALTLIRDLPVWVDGKETALSAGNQIYITKTDDVGIAWFETVDGTMSGEIHYVRPDDDYQLYVNDLSEYEYFEALPYAG